MHFSCKITNAVLSFLEHHGEDLSPLYDPMFPPMEVLRDPSSWLSAPEMEAYLETLSRMSWAKHEAGELALVAGHAGPKNHAWGVLDSVLRLMPRPQEILNQPERFLSYFISPEPPIENLKRSEASVSFDLPLPAEQYPMVTMYLKAAFESLPLYVGQNRAICEWEGIHLQVHWPELQESIFVQDPGHQISPDLLQSVIADHQRLQRDLEDKNRELQRKSDEIRELKMDLEKGVRTAAILNAEAALSSLLNEEPPTEQPPAYKIEQNMARLHDYMVRAQQLVVVLSGLVKKEKEPAVKEALRRLDWDHVKQQYPRTIASSMEELRRLQSRSSSQRVQEEDRHV